MIYAYSDEINKVGTVTVMLLDQWDKENIEDAFKKAGINTQAPEEVIDKNYFLKSINLSAPGEFQTIIVAHYPNFTFGVRIMAAYKTARELNFNVGFEDLLTKVGYVIQEAYMTRTEQIITQAKTNTTGCLKSMNNGKVRRHCISSLDERGSYSGVCMVCGKTMT